MIYLVTGGAGFIGSTYVKYLLNAGETVVVLDSLTYAGNLSNISEYLTRENIIIPIDQRRLFYAKIHDFNSISNDANIDIEKDRLNYKTKLYDINKVQNSDLKMTISKTILSNSLVFVYGNVIDNSLSDILLSLCDVVVHFAAETHVDRSILSPFNFIKTDYFGTYNLLESARKNNGLHKFVYISTDEVYGETIDASFKETSTLSPRNPYSASKTAADRLVYAYHQTYGLPVNIIRPSNNFGPNQYPEKLIPLMITKALMNEKLPIYGDGKQIRDWLFVQDTVRAITLIINEGKPGETYNVAGHNEQENIAVVKMILALLKLDTSLIRHVRDRPGHDRRYSIDDSKLRDELGFTSEGNFNDQLKDTVQWYVTNKKWWQDISEENLHYKEFMDKWYGL